MQCRHFHSVPTRATKPTGSMPSGWRSRHSGTLQKTLDDTLHYLQQASAYYNLALQANPGEKYFSQPYSRKGFNFGKLLRPGAGGRYTSTESYPAPLARVQEALVDYQRIKEFHPAVEAESKSVPVGGTGAIDNKGRNALSNRDVIEMVKAGLAEDVIITSIDSAEDPDFDVSPRGLIELGKAKVNKVIMQHIQARMK